MSPRAIASGERQFASSAPAATAPTARRRSEASGYAPELNNPEFLDAASDGFLLATIARGRKRARRCAPFGAGAAGMVSARCARR